MYYSKFPPFTIFDGIELYPRHWNKKDVLRRDVMSKWAWQPVTNVEFSLFLKLNGNEIGENFISPPGDAPDYYFLYETPEFLVFLRNFRHLGDRHKYHYSLWRLAKSKANVPCKIRKEKLKWDGQILPIPYGKCKLVWNGSVQTPIVELIKP